MALAPQLMVPHGHHQVQVVVVVAAVVVAASPAAAPPWQRCLRCTARRQSRVGEA
jgi:hypothetical protein